MMKAVCRLFFGMWKVHKIQLLQFSKPLFTPGIVLQHCGCTANADTPAIAGDLVLPCNPPCCGARPWIV